ncbi:sporozoite surface protein 2-like [Pseudochaenichthys georgianus]|uniref:sporozoite surface protein 2-like n=1 Tax=Pseudochaenichthys georgianus TaxID=52239 RepID=UPI00146BD2EB|nr:sporozoite surface protein 2-like [Pseudochaenichthys georgianus]
MYFGLCVRVLVISLLIFGQQAKTLRHRSGGSSGITPHFDFSRSLKPASTSSDDSSAQPERVLGSYSPFHADGALSETLKPAAAPSAGGYSGSHGRQVDGYSPEGSVSSYGPSQPIIRKPNQLPQANPSANGVLPSKAAPSAFPLPHNPNSFQSGIASSFAIVMHSGPYSKPQQPKNLPKPHQPKPQQAANPSNPLQSWYQPKPQQTKPNQPSYPSNPQQAKLYQPSNPQQAKPYQPAYPLNPQQATNPSSPLQSRYRPKPQQPSYTSNPLQSRYRSKPQQRSYPSNPQQAKPQQAEPLQGVLQSKAGMWYFPSEGSVSSGSNVQAKPYQPANPLNPQRATNPSSPLQSWNQPKPQHPAYPSNPQQAKPYRPSYPLNPQQAKPYQLAYPSNPLQSRYRAKPQQPSYPSNPLQSRYQPKPQLPAYPSNPQQANPYWPSYPSNPQQAKPYQPAYPSNPQQAVPLQGVLQSKAGMWDFPSQRSVASGSNVQPTDSNSHLNIDPRSLREIPMPFPYQPRWPQQLVPV